MTVSPMARHRAAVGALELPPHPVLRDGAVFTLSLSSGANRPFAAFSLSFHRLSLPVTAVLLVPQVYEATLAGEYTMNIYLCNEPVEAIPVFPELVHTAVGETLPC